MRILVAGAGGFLGSHLVESLLAKGHEVLGVDNFRTGSKSNVADFMQNASFEFLRHDVTFPLYVEVDAIFNLASPASPKHYQKDPVQTLKTNVLGAINLLGLAKRLNVPLVQASTSEVYGDPAVHPQPESYWGNVNPIGIRSCYDEGKRAAESICFDYRRMHGIQVSVVRIFNTYGPKMAADDGRVVTEFIQAALKGERIPLFGDGSQTRSFCYVSDTVRGLELALEKSDRLDAPVNIGNPNEISVREIGEMIVELTGSSSEFEELPLPSDDPKQRCPDIGRAKQTLDWEPSVGLREGLIRTIEYFRKVS